MNLPKLKNESNGDGGAHKRKAQLPAVASGSAPPPASLSPTAAAALAYARRRWLVFPVHGVVRGRCTCGRQDCEHPGKHPRTPRGFRDASTDEAQIRAWWQRWPDSNIGFWPGPSGLLVVDVDGPEGEQTARALGLASEPTLQVRTGRPEGGRHLYLGAPDFPVGNVDVGVGVDVRAHGGFVVVPPSVHASGARYQWEGRIEDLRPCPPAFAERLRNGQPATASAPPAEAEGVPEGRRNTTLARLLGRLLLKHPVAEAVDLAWGINTTQFRPALERREFDATVASITKAEVRKVGASLREPTPDESDHEICSHPPLEPPVLDHVALYGPLGDWVRAVAPHTEASPAALLASAVVGIGALIGRSPFCTLDGARHGLNLFGLLIGPTSSGRKGTASAWSRRLLHHLDPDFRTNIVAGLSSGEGLINAIRDARDGGGDGKGGDPGVPDKRLLVVEGEFSSVLRTQRRDGNILGAVLREAWDGYTLRTLTKGSPQTATDPHVAVLGMITPDELRRLLADTDFSCGYLNRFLLVWAERSQLLPFGGHLEERIEEELVEALARAVGRARQRGDLSTVTPTARRWWAEAYPRLTTGHPGRVGAATQRGAAQVRRLALLYAALDGADLVDVQHLDAAGALWRYAEQTALYVFGRSELSQRAQRLEAALDGAGVAGMTRTAIRQAVGSHNVPAKEIEAALLELRDSGTARMVKDPETEGRPREVWVHVRHLQPVVLGRDGSNRNDANYTGEEVSSHQSHPSLDPQPKGELETLKEIFDLEPVDGGTDSFPLAPPSEPPA